MSSHDNKRVNGVVKSKIGLVETVATVTEEPIIETRECVKIKKCNHDGQWEDWLNISIWGKSCR